MPRKLALFLNLLLLGSLATAEPVRPELPHEVAMNKEAGRGGHLVVNLRMQDGGKLPFIVDTGSPITLLDTSLAPTLGQRVGRLTISTLDGDRQKSGRYAAPKLFLGNTPLMIGSNVATFRLADHAEPPAMGILGMDCLRHYCLQLDFEAGKLRFLDPDHLNPDELGRAFPMSFSGGYPILHHAGFLGEGTNLLIDVGCSIDGLAPKETVRGEAVFCSELVWAGGTYTNVLFDAVDHAKVLGLRFLARHLVTLNFPKRTLYLKQIRAGPLTEDTALGTPRLGELDVALAYLDRLKSKGRLPGWSNGDKGAIYFEKVTHARGKYLKSVTIGFRKTGDFDRSHYLLSRDSEESPWLLQKAWRTDQTGRTIEKYPVH